MHNLIPFTGAESATVPEWAIFCLTGFAIILALGYYKVLSSGALQMEAHQRTSAASAPPAKKPQNKPIPTRLIVCVDGTWGNPDGRVGNPQGNVSTVFRTFASVEEGMVTDKATGQQWRQKRKYFNGLGDRRNQLKHYLSGATGSGLSAEIEKVYKYCCLNTDGPDDEIYFFGFSRGAFTIRAVANLLCYMHAPSRSHSGSNEFAEYYRDMLELYPHIIAGNNNMAGGQLHHHFSRSTKPPVVRFVGAFDTVKAFADKGVYNILPHSRIQHFRHALALNEEREQFKPETDLPDQLNTPSTKHSVLQAWFIGTHEDLGGANSKDGLSLYPLQWILSEAEMFGLTLGFHEIYTDYGDTGFDSQPYIDDPTKLIMPPQSKRDETGSRHSEMSLHLENGINVRLWDLCDVHETRKDGFKVKINSSYWGVAHKVLWTIKPRCMFQGDTLIGYNPTSPVGTFVHPSVYQVLDENPSIRDVSGGWPFSKALSLFRHRAIPDEGYIFWEHPSPAMKKRLEKIRILICGAAGVGKSSLVNKVLVGNYSQVSASTHQKHDVEHEITAPDLPYIIHDSEGFQSGDKNEESKAVRDFLKTRSREPKLPDRVHTIWYCIPSGHERESRPKSDSDKDFFNVLNECKSTIPVVVICSKLDKLRAMYRGELEEEEDNGSPSDDQRRRTVNAKVAQRVSLFESKIKDALLSASQGYPYMAGPIFTSEKNAKSIQNLVKVTYDNFTNDQVRAMFSQTQGVNVEIKVKEAIKEALRLYKHAVRTSAIPLALTGGVSTAVVAPTIVGAICNIFNFRGISGDIAWQCLRNVLVSNSAANVVQLFAQSATLVGFAMAETGIGAVPGVVIATSAAAVNIVSTPQFSRALLMCALDTIIIMDHAFWQCDNEEKEIEKKDINKSTEWFTKHSHMVHEDIKSLVRIWNPFEAFDYKRLQTEMHAIVERYRFHPDVLSDHDHQEASSIDQTPTDPVIQKSFWQGWFGR